MDTSLLKYVIVLAPVFTVIGASAFCLISKCHKCIKKRRPEEAQTRRDFHGQNVFFDGPMKQKYSTSSNINSTATDSDARRYEIQDSGFEDCDIENSEIKKPDIEKSETVVRIEDDDTKKLLDTGT